MSLAVTSCFYQADAVADRGARSATSSLHTRIVLSADIEWQALNPARGELGPKAATLWGDRNAATPTGFLAAFTDGFSSPPHVHNVTYRAVVISGGIHNDDPYAEHSWMAPGSFWTQPKGEIHITAAQGETNVALVEISRGPYLVKPTSSAFDSGERALNVHASNLVWLPAPANSGDARAAQIAYLWGQQLDGVSRGVFLKFPAGFVGDIRADGSEFHAVVIRGTLRHAGSQDNVLTPGSYFGSQHASEHHVNSGADEVTVVYIRTNGRLRVHASLP